jgi:hypothetical protein
LAIAVLTNASVVFNSVDLSDHVESVEIDFAYDDVEITAMGATAKAYAPGLRDDKITVNFYQDFALAEVDQTLNSFLGSAAGASLVVKPAAGTTSSVNPAYTMTATLYSYQPLSAKVGEASMTSVEFRPAAGSAIVRAIT